MLSLKSKLFFKRKIQLTITLLFLTLFSHAQKLKVLEGDYENLKGVKEYNLIFDYTDVEIKDYNSEEEYILSEINRRVEKRSGEGEGFRDEWFSNRAYRYEPRFMEPFNRYFKKGEVKVIKDLKDSEYTMKIQTTYIYPGKSGFYMKESEIKAKIIIYKTNAPSEKLLVVEFEDINGYYQGDKAIMRGYEFHTGERIAFAYWTLGKFFAKKLRMGIK